MRGLREVETHPPTRIPKPEGVQASRRDLCDYDGLGCSPSNTPSAASISVIKAQIQQNDLGHIASCHSVHVGVVAHRHYIDYLCRVARARLWKRLRAVGLSREYHGFQKTSRGMEASRRFRASRHLWMCRKSSRHRCIISPPQSDCRN